MSPNHHSSEESKLGALSAPSSRDSSPRPDSVSPIQQQCIVRTLSIVSWFNLLYFQMYFIVKERLTLKY